MNAKVWHGKTLDTLSFPSLLSSASYPFIASPSFILNYQSNLKISFLNAKSVLSNSSILLILNEKGQVFHLKHLGSDWPLQIPPNTLTCIQDLPQISQISLSSTHAACLTAEGQLYTWGHSNIGQLCHALRSFVAEPLQVSSLSCFKMTQVVCGNGFTAVLTIGCYVHIYGELGLVHSQSTHSNKKLQAFSHSLLNKEKIVMIQAGSNFLAALNETGEVFAMDGCMDLVGLPLRSEWKVESISATDKSLLGKVPSGLVLWDWSSRASDDCCLSLAVGRFFKFIGDFRAFRWGESFLIDGLVEENGVEIRPYVRSELGKAILKKNRRNTGGIVLEDSLIRRSKSDSVRFEEIDKSFRESFLDCLEKNVLRSLNERLREGFQGIKKYSLIKHWEKTSLRTGRFLNLISSTQKKIESYFKFFGFYKMKLLSFANYTESSIELRVNKFRKNIEKVQKKRLMKYFKVFSLNSQLEKTDESIKEKVLNKRRTCSKAQDKLKTLIRLTNKSLKYQVFKFIKDCSKGTLFGSKKNPKDIQTALLNSVLSSTQRHLKSFSFQKIKALLKSTHPFSSLKALPNRTLNLSFRLLTRTYKNLFRPIKSLLLKRVTFYFSLILIKSFSRYHLHLSKLLLTIQSILSKCQIRHKLQSFKLIQINPESSIRTPSFSSQLTVSRSFSYMNLDPIQETPQKTKLIHSKSPAVPRFSLPPKLAKSESHQFYSKSPSLRETLNSNLSPKNHEKATEPKRPPWIPSSFFTTPISPNRQIAQTRRKEYEEQLRSRKPRRILAKNRKKLISPRPSKILTPYIESNFERSFGIMELNKTLSSALKTAKIKAFSDIKSWSQLKSKPAPCPKDEEVQVTWKDRLFILAAALTQSVIDKATKREIFNLLS